MLREILAVVQGKGTARVEDVARRMCVDPDFIVYLLDDLRRRGYLERYPPAVTCSGGCAGCARKPTGKTFGMRAWKLTEKGKLVLRKSTGSFVERF